MIWVTSFGIIVAMALMLLKALLDPSLYDCVSSKFVWNQDSTVVGIVRFFKGVSGFTGYRMRLLHNAKNVRSFIVSSGFSLKIA